MRNLFIAFILLTTHFLYGQVNDLTQCGTLNNCEVSIINFAKDFYALPPSDCKLWEGACGEDNEIYRMGSVTIAGQQSYSDYKLAVRHGIITEQLKICNQEWCDYVFEDTFNLMPLNTLEQYLQTNRHLPDTRSEKEILEDGGISLEIETVSQQKNIEEIFLHLIDLDKRTNQLLANVPANPNKREKANPVLMVPTPTHVEYSPAMMVTVNGFQIKAASATNVSNGIAGILITDGPGEVNLSWTGAATGTLNNISCKSVISIYNLKSGPYTLTVKDITGIIIGTCSFSINQTPVQCSSLSNSCSQQILSLVKNNLPSPECRQWQSGTTDPTYDCSIQSRIFRSGSVCIGTSLSQSGFNLAVKGGISTDEFIIELCETEGWCDYVFNPEYPLMPLSELETYLMEKKHLPGIISQKEIQQQEGYEMKQIKLAQQVKIEEAFLHLINLENQKAELEARLSDY